LFLLFFVRFRLWKRRYGFSEYLPRYSEFANVFKVTSFALFDDKARAFRAKTDVMRTEPEQAKPEPPVKKRVLIRNWGD
jgi:hypothetical protein